MMTEILKKSLKVLLLLSSISVMAEEIISFEDITCKPLPNAYNIVQGKKYLGRVQLFGKDARNIDKLKVWSENNKLVIDTRAFHADNPNMEVSFTRNLENVKPGEKISADIDANSLDENHEGWFFFTGHLESGKHFHEKNKNEMEQRRTSITVLNNHSP
eukprot:TRINITY_DN942_c0_g2_i1.p2 TRINITY_DN942_c0_g2~~TRINITY_DN942_c0_g2_i1.p2  ORF type:complete len:159 (+),score=27.88 TRINITY_DN942_c0_g2_i1:801-1277(+)